MTNVAGIDASGIDSGADADVPGIDSDSDSATLILDKKYPAFGGVLFIKYAPFMHICRTLIRCRLMLMLMRFYRARTHRGRHNNRG